MKKGWKIFLGICGGVFLVGCALCVTSLVLGFSWERAKHLYPHGIGLVWTDESSGDYYSGTQFNETFEGVKEIDLDVSAVEVNIYQEENQENSVRVECRNIPSKLRYQAVLNEGKLKIETAKNVFHGTNDSVIDIYLPKSVRLEKASLKIGAGSLAVDEIQAGELKVEVGAGAGEILQIQAEEISAKVGAGSLSLEGNVGKEAELKCTAGSLSALWQGKKMDFNYKIDASSGNMMLGEEQMQFERKQEIDNHAAKEMELDCSVGEMVIEFEE